jgi:LEA14-like dessication related protein
MMRIRAGVKFALLLAVVFWAGCETLQQALMLQKPSAALKGLRLGDITIQSATFLFDVEVENPYSVGLPLLNMDYDVKMGAGKLFSGVADIATVIPAKDKATVSLPAEVAYLDLLAAVKGLRPGSQMPYRADAGLSVDASALGTIRLPLSKEGQVTVPDLSTLKQIDWRKVLDSATGG